MARRSDHSREELTALALAAARRIVAEQDIEALTARKVAGAIGYSPGTLYNVFEDLDDLVVRLNGETLEALHRRLEAVPRTADPAGDLRRMLAAYLGFLEENRNLWNALFEFRLPEGRTLPDWYAAKIARTLTLIESVLAAVAPRLPPERTAQAARVLWAGLHGICSLSGAGKLATVTDQPVEELAGLLLDCFVAGLERSAAEE